MSCSSREDLGSYWKGMSTSRVVPHSEPVYADGWNSVEEKVKSMETRERRNPGTVQIAGIARDRTNSSVAVMELICLPENCAS